jgi:pyruvate formate lyase activating enzyme
MDAAEHIEHTGRHNKPILENLTMLSEMGRNIQVRVPIIPGVTDGPVNIQAIGRFVAGLPNRHPVTLLGHHAMAMDKYPRFGMDDMLPAGTDAPSRSALSRIASDLEALGLEVAY